MDKEQALHQFWSSLGIAAYEENSVPDGATFPYVTYQKLSGRLEDALYPTGSIWTRNSSWAEADALKRQLEAKFEHGGIIYKLDNGRIYISQGSPFAQGMSDDVDKMVKRYVINLAVEFLTAY